MSEISTEFKGTDGGEERCAGIISGTAEDTDSTMLAFVELGGERWDDARGDDVDDVLVGGR